MKINVVFNKHIENYKESLSEIETALINSKAEFRSFELDSMENWGDFTLVVGGDGTLLRVARFYSEWKIPVLGINLGRLGFLSQGSIIEISSIIEAILAGNYCTE